MNNLKTAEPSDTRGYDLEDRLVRFACAIIDITDALPNTRAGNHIAGQLVRAGTSPSPNYGEAQGAESRRDFVHKMKISFKELKECRGWLKIILMKNLIQDEGKTRNVLSECEELIRIFAKSISTARANMRQQPDV